LPNIKADSFDTERATMPEQRLLISIIFRAWTDLSSRNRFIQNDAYFWITDKKETCDAWSFVWCCQGAGIDPVATKKEILKNPFKGGWTTFINNKKKLIDESIL
jgi:hypothetical protein